MAAGEDAFLTIGVDGSPSADQALDWAIAEAHRRSLALQIVTVWHGGRATHLDAERVVDAAAKHVADAGVVSTTEVLEGHPASELLRLAQAADQLVVGARGTSSVGRFLLGSVSTAVSHHCAGPVTIVRQSARHTHHRVVVGIDGSDCATAALRRAALEAIAARAELHVVAAWQLLNTELVGDFAGIGLPQLDDVREWAQARASTLITDEAASLRGCRVRLDVVHAPPVHALLSAAAHSDLLVVGTRGYGAFDRMLLGSVSAACVYHASCPVQLVPG